MSESGTQSDEQKILRYGQIVALHFFGDENGFISADGHINKYVQMRGYGKYYSAQYANKNETKEINKDDFSNCLFQIYPKVVNTLKSKITRDLIAYKAQQLLEEDDNELTKEKLQMLKFAGSIEKTNEKNPEKNVGKNLGTLAQPTQEEDDMEEKDALLKKITKYQIMLQNEFKFNVDTFEINKGAPLSYAEPFQLLHLNSSKFMACNFVESKFEKENYEIALEEYPSDSSLFRIMPAFKYQKDSSSTIREGDCVWIVRSIPFNNKIIHLHSSIELSEMKSRAYAQKSIALNFTQNLTPMKSIPKNNNSKTQKTLKDFSQKEKIAIEKREINGCLEQATVLKFKIYQNINVQNNKYLNCGDAIWLHHSEANSALSVIRKERGMTRYTFTSINIESWITKSNLEIFVGQNKENATFEDYSGNSFGLWVIENVDFKLGGQVEYGVGYRLKHLSTGYYLTVIDENQIIVDQKLKDLNKQKEEEKKKEKKNTKIINKGRYDREEKEEDEDEDDDEVEDGIINDNNNNNNDSNGMLNGEPKEEGKKVTIMDTNKGESDSDGFDDTTKKTKSFKTLNTGDETNQGILLSKKVSTAEKLPQQLELPNITKIKKKKKKVDKEAELRILRSKMTKKWKLDLTTNATDPFTLFQFFALGTSPSIYDQYVEQGNFIFLRNIESKQWLDVLNLLTSTQQENSEVPAQMKNFQAQNQLSEFNQDESTYAFSPLRAVLKSDQAENQVFKVFQTSSNEVWESKFVVSCSNILLKFLLNQKRLSFLCDTGDELAIKKAKDKIKMSRTCIQNINNFCSNKLLNYQPDQKLGVPNPKRQKLLREQYYIDFLIKILEDLLPKTDLNLWIEYKKIMDKEKSEKEKESKYNQDESSSDEEDDEKQFKKDHLSIPQFGKSSALKKSKKKKRNRVSKLQRKEHAYYLKEKVEMAKDIYILLSTLCKNNPSNEEYTFKLIPFFQIHCKYLPEAIDCLINLVSHNEKILLSLSENLRIDFDYERKEESEQKDSQAVKIIINLFENSSTQKSENEKIKFQQHEKITSKPVNLILFFMNLIWEENSLQKSNYLRFLRSLCRIEDKGIALNQENIFKVYKKYTKIRNVIRYDQYFKSGSIKLPEISQDPKQFEYDVSEQMKFYSELSFGRNFLWRKELIPHFSNYYLLQNIWSQNDLKDFPLLRSCFCQLAMSLYIDHEPLQKKEVPNFCRLFEIVGEEKEDKIFDEEQNQENEIVMYKSLIQGLQNYLASISKQIMELTSIYSFKDKLQRDMAFKLAKKGKSILEDPLLLNSMEMLNLLVELNLFGSLQATHLYKEFIPYLLNILVYDLKNIENFTAFSQTLQEQSNRRKEQKEQKNDPTLFLGLSNINNRLKNVASSLNKTVASVSGKGNDEEQKPSNEVDYELDSQDLVNLLDQDKLYDNHIMRGQIKLHNQLEEMNYSDSIKYKNEALVKIKVLDTLEKMMDLRQNYLMTNLLKFFKDYIATSVKEVDENKSKAQIQEIVREHLKGFLPNIPLTGIEAVDNLFTPQTSSNLFKDLSKLNIVNFKKQTKPPPKDKFTQYIKQDEYIHYQDINNLLSASFEKSDKYEDPVTTCLPQLLSSFLIIYDENLEKRLLKVMIRMYSQRYDLLENVEKMQIIFDKQTSDLFVRLEDLYLKLKKYDEQSEVWFTTLASNDYKTHPICQLIELLDNLNNGFFKCIAQKNGGSIVLMEKGPRSLLKVIKDKQKIYQYLKLQEPIISIIREGMHHFDSFILNESYPIEKKCYLIKLFELLYEFLFYFTTDQKENQQIIYKHFSLFSQYLKYDLGQMKLICSIYQDNPPLLNSVSKPFLNTFLDLIETEGRQAHSLQIFSAIMKCNNKYIFDNQLLILNTFLPQKNMGEKEYNLLYANGSNVKQFRFQLEDICNSLKRESLNTKLKEVQYRDTFRDEPFIYHIQLLNLLLEACFISKEQEEKKDDKKQNTSTNAKKKKHEEDNKDIVLKDSQPQQEWQIESDQKEIPNSDQNEEEDEEGQTTKEQKLEEEKKQQSIQIAKAWQNDKAFGDTKFNISIVRLKKVFKVYDLLQMLSLEDAYADWHKFSNQINQKEKIPEKIKATEGKQGIFEEALNDKEELERQKQREESKKKYLSSTATQDDLYKAQKMMLKRGMNLLKPHLLSFMRKVHVVSENVISSQSEMIQQQKEITVFFDKEAIKLSCLLEGTFNEEYVEYIFDYMLPFLHDYHKKFVERGPHNQHIQDDEERRDDKSLESLLDKIIFKIPLFSSHLTKSQKNRITFVSKSIKGIDYKIVIPEVILIENTLSAPRRLPPLSTKKIPSSILSPQKLNLPISSFKQSERKFNFSDREIIEVVGEGDVDDEEILLKQASDRVFSSKTAATIGAIKMASRVAVSNSNTQSNLIALNWNTFKNVLKEDNKVKEQVKQEKSALAEAIVRVKDTIKPELAKDLVLKPDMFKLIMKFLKFLHYAPDDPKNKNTIISLISVLKEVIESKGIEKKSEVAEEDEEEKEQEKRKKIQCMFNQLGAMKMILSVLSSTNQHLDNELIINYLSFANCLLEGGNNQIQTTIYQYFMTYQKSEIIFHRFNSIIRTQIRTIESSSQNSEIQIESENKQIIQLLEVVLRFLQLCVEGHYIDLQNYLRKQENSRNNFDMVQAVADLLKAYYYGDCTQKMYDNMIFCLDTLSEFVQGPCKDNQEAVSDSKFFDIASDLFTKKAKTDEMKIAIKEKKIERMKQKKKKDINFSEYYRLQEDQPLTEWMIARLQNKVLILVLSLLESREVKHNCEIIKRIMRNLPLYVLQRHLIKSFKKFQAFHGGNFNRSSLQHMEKDPRLESDAQFFKKLREEGQDEEEYLECILQNGFQIYFLLSYYIESDDTLGGEMVKIFKNYEKKILNNEKSDLEDLLTGDNLIGQLILFSTSLIESVLKYIETVKQKAVDAAKILIVLGEENKKDPAKQAARSKRLRSAMKFFSTNSSHIDIVRNDLLELVYFIRLPATNCLPKEIKTDFHERCDRSNIKTKQLTLVKEASDIIQICKHEYSLKILFSSNKLLALFANFVKLWKDLSFFISVIINFFIILSFSAEPGGPWSLRMSDYNLFNSTNYTQSDTNQLFLILGIILIICSNFVLLFFLFKNVPLIIQKAMGSGMQLKDYKSYLGKLMVLIIKPLQIILMFFQDFYLVYFIMYGAFAVIGTFVHPFFFTFHLSAILMRYPTLKNVIMSVYLPRKQLLLTFVLFVVLEYSFSVWGYIQYYDEFGDRCNSLLYCFLTTFDQTFKPNGGVGGFFVDNYQDTKNTAKHRLSLFFFDQLFQYIMLNIMINIVVGIIIDTFGVLREQSNERSQDMNNQCFICGIDKTTFDRKSDTGKGFGKHIKFNHYMWNYIHFIQYLEWKERSEYTGIESYVDELLQQNDTYWMPFKMAREIGEGEDDDEEMDLNQLENIEKKQNQLIDEISTLTESVLELQKEKKEKKMK